MSSIAVNEHAPWACSKAATNAGMPDYFASRFSIARTIVERGDAFVRVSGIGVAVPAASGSPGTLRRPIGAKPIFLSLSTCSMRRGSMTDPLRIAVNQRRIAHEIDQTWDATCRAPYELVRSGVNSPGSPPAPVKR